MSTLNQITWLFRNPGTQKAAVFLSLIDAGVIVLGVLAFASHHVRIGLVVFSLYIIGYAVLRHVIKTRLAAASESNDPGSFEDDDPPMYESEGDYDEGDYDEFSGC